MKLNNDQAADIIFDLQEARKPTRNEALIRAFIALKFFDSEERLDELVLEWEAFDREWKRREKHESNKKRRSRNRKFHG